MSQLIIFIYRVLTALIVWPLCLAVRNHPNFENTIRQRLALKLPDVPGGDLIWLHGASLGEIRALAGLIEDLKARKQGTVICLSAMTATGRQAAMSIKGADIVIPLPFDVRRIMNRYMRHLAPKVLVIAETEIWPNMLLAAEANSIPVIIINARLSERAFRRYLHIKPLTRRLLEKVRILAMAEEHDERFRALGAANVGSAGNIKFDTVAKLEIGRVESLRKELGIGKRPVFIAGSIRTGEERDIIEAIADIRKKIPETFCVVAPRHHERIKFVTDAAAQRAMTWSFRSEGSAGADILILDTVGELFDFYGLSDAAFIGGSLVKLGGQNILEPVAWGVPTVHGPHMDNFLWAMEVIGRYTTTVTDAAGLSREIVSIISRPDVYRQKAQMAQAALDGAKGATKRYSDEILQIFTK